MEVKIYRICKDNPLPTRADPTDAGYDVYAAEEVKFTFDRSKLVPLGIIAQAPEGYHFKLVLRSSMAWKRGFSLDNSVGIIDHKYCGKYDEIKALIKAPSFAVCRMKKLPNTNLIIKKGERVAQLLLEKNVDIEWEEQDDRDFAGQSRGGFGSTGE